MRRGRRSHLARRRAAAVIGVVALFAGACGGGPEPGRAQPGLGRAPREASPGDVGLTRFGLGKPLPSGLGCLRDLPPRDLAPAPLPPDLPIPAGSYPVRNTAPVPAGIDRRVELVVPMAMDRFVSYVRTELAARDWVLGRSESEPGESELVVYKPPWVGAFRVRSSYCDRGRSAVMVVLQELRS